MKKFPFVLLLVAIISFIAVGCSTVGEGSDDGTVKPPVADSTENLVQGYFVVENGVLAEKYPFTKLSDSEYVAYYPYSGEGSASISGGYGWTTKVADISYGNKVLSEKGMYEVKLNTSTGTLTAEKMVGNYAVLSVEEDGILTANQVLSRLTKKGSLKSLNIVTIADDGSYTVGNVGTTVLNFGDLGNYAMKVLGTNFLSL